MNRRIKNLLLWTYALLGALLVVLLLRMFVCTTCVMPCGELLFVNKWSYGLRTPFPSLFGYHRLLFEPVQTGDKVAFVNPLENGPLEFRQLYVCHCAATTGSTIQLHGKPFRIPRKGESIEVTSENKALLHEVISQHEKEQAIIGSDGTLYVDGIPITHYTFTHNYYWMEVGNKEHLLDSRHFGLIPEELIIGRVFYEIEATKGIL